MAGFNTLIMGATTIDDIKNKIIAFNDEHAKDTTENIPKIEFKEDEHHMIVYSVSNKRTGNAIDDDTKSVIIDKDTMRPIVTQFNKIIYNDDAVEFLKQKDWKNVSVKYCFEGTMIIVFYSHDKWYICTRKCLDASTSQWIKGISYYDLFMEAIKGKFAVENLDKRYCYHFVLVHHKNKNIVDYSWLGKQYKTVALVMTTEKYTYNRVDCVVSDKILYPSTMTFNNIDEIIVELANISDGDRQTYHISTEGFMIEYRDGGSLISLKMQTPIYKNISENKPNTSNMDAMFLELYQTNKLKEFAPYFTQHCGEVVNRIHNAVKTVSSEMLNLYHITRSHKNEKLYSVLPASYRHALYEIHGRYIKKHDKETEKAASNALNDKKSITIYDVYDVLKQIEPFTLRKIFIDRISLLDKPEMNQYLRKDDFDVMLQGKLMM